jgi:hypothetical protein
MKKAIISIIIIFILIICYGFYIEPNNFKITENTIQIANLPDSFNGFKIVQFSDFLLGSTKNIDDLEIIVNEINNLNPDIIVFTGDLITKDYNITSNDITNLEKTLKKLKCNLYKYAIIGDNDQKYLDTYKKILENSDFKLLDNESTYIFYKDILPIKLTGITNISNLDEALSTDDNFDTFYNIVITHFPDYIETLSNTSTNLVIAGHSLLGQIRIPFFGGIITKDNARTYLDNYYKVNNTIMYVSSGLGTENISFRLLNSPEINLYRLEQSN